MEEEAPKALYVHVPFCLAKCSYCDFYSVVKTSGAVEKYLAALRKELELTAEERTQDFSTIYVGGGTPTALSADELAQLLSTLCGQVAFAAPVEFTVEANPGTLDADKLHVLRIHGVNRLSIGAQSFDDGLLKLLGRRHNSRDILDVLAAAREADFTNLSLDLIFGIPTQGPSDWERDLDELLRCNVPHVSAYSLTYEENTPLARRAAAGQLERVSEADELTMYETVIDGLTTEGYEHYEISNFARPDFRCAHNEVYWANAAYLGLGPSAASYISGERRRNASSLTDYVARLGAGELAVGFRERLAPEKRARETAVMNLRRTHGIDFDEFQRRTGFNASALLGEELQVLAQEGLIQVGERSAALTRRGLMVADTVLSELV
ncbi:MAG: hypothetical protein AMS16_03115 [Planctomycetes bacterium DG_58]|nr:MAG: hypothetical protein AMS16_03115 [Planctomycetes bacterium DG_58]